jgi:hypothetical protein
MKSIEMDGRDTGGRMTAFFGSGIEGLDLGDRGGRKQYRRVRRRRTALD